MEEKKFIDRTATWQQQRTLHCWVHRSTVATIHSLWCVIFFKLLRFLDLHLAIPRDIWPELATFDETWHAPGSNGILASIKNNGKWMSDAILGHLKVLLWKIDLKLRIYVKKKKEEEEEWSSILIAKIGHT